MTRFPPNIHNDRASSKQLQYHQQYLSLVFTAAQPPFGSHQHRLDSSTCVQFKLNAPLFHQPCPVCFGIGPLLFSSHLHSPRKNKKVILKKSIGLLRENKLILALLIKNKKQSPLVCSSFMIFLSFQLIK